MKINYNITGAKRKTLVNAISQELNASAKYLGAPSFSYEVANYIIDRNGMLEVEDNQELVANILSLHNFEALSEEYDSSHKIDEGFLETEDNSLIIEMPKSNFTEDSIEILKKLIENKESLIKKALGLNSLPIIISEEIISFPWFYGEYSPDEVNAYTHFISALCKLANTQKRINVSERTIENEKYTFRCFLLRLGFIGPEYKAHRKILLSKLTGCSAFRNGLPANEEAEKQ